MSDTTPNFDLLDDATWDTPARRKIAESEIPSKVTDLVKQLAERGIPLNIPGDESYQAEMTPYFKAAAEHIGMQARVWTNYEDAKAKTGRLGFKVSVGKRRGSAVPGADADEDEED